MKETSVSKKNDLEVKTILVSQPKPEYSPYYKLEERYGITIDWRPFINVEPVPENETRKPRIRPHEYTAITFTSRNSIDHSLSLCEEMRVEIQPKSEYMLMSAVI